MILYSAFLNLAITFSDITRHSVDERFCLQPSAMTFKRHSWCHIDVYQPVEVPAISNSYWTCICSGSLCPSYIKSNSDSSFAFRFTQKDLCATINDNISSAILAMKYIDGTNIVGNCKMHKAKLILKHATGLAKCKKWYSH